MTHRGRWGGVWLIAIVASSPLWAKGRQPPTFSFEIDPSTVTAGRTAVVTCRSDTPLRQPTLYFNEGKAYFYPAGKRVWKTLVGISSMEEPGEKKARFYTETPRGKVHQSTLTFVVEPGTYPVSQVRLPAQKDTLLTSGQVSRDAALLSGFYQPPLTSQKRWDGFFVMPATGIFSSIYGARRSYGSRKERSAHTGLDIANAAGTPVQAPNRGRVVFAGWLDSFGHTVMLDHGWGVFSYYLHMEKIFVTEGQDVETGTLLGQMGAEGLATGPHLHWSLTVAGERVDPLEWTEREIP